MTFGGTRRRATTGLRSGIIGLGFIGEIHARAVHAAGGTLTAVADASPVDVEDSAHQLGAAWGAASAEELVTSPDVDVVHICTPNHLHAPLVRMALSAGKHVICEKPLATSRADAAELVELARAAGVVAAVPFIYRYYPTVREARARIASGASGPIHLIHGSYLQDWLSTAKDQNWRVDPTLGGASRTFGDIGVHWCDLVEFATGQRITALAARLITAVPERANGAGGLASTQRVATEDAATLVQRGSSDLSEDAQRLSVLPAGHPQGYQECFNGFVADVYAAVAGEAPEGLPRFEDGLRAAELTEAVLASAASRSGGQHESRTTAGPSSTTSCTGSRPMARRWRTSGSWRTPTGRRPPTSTRSRPPAARTCS